MGLIIFVGLLILFVLVALVILGFIISVTYEHIGISLSGTFTFLIIIWLIIFPTVLLFYKSAETKVNMFNKRYDTGFTVDEMFWSEETVEDFIKEIKEKE